MRHYDLISETKRQLMIIQNRGKHTTGRNARHNKVQGNFVSFRQKMVHQDMIKTDSNFINKFMQSHHFHHHLRI